MNLLSALMPGVRDFRTPFTVGAIWAAVFLVAGYDSRSSLLSAPIAADARGVLETLPTSVKSAVGLFAVYILGLVATGATRFMGRVLSIVVRRLFNFRIVWTNPLAWRALRPAQMSERATAMIEGSIRERMMPISPLMAGLVPSRLVVSEFALAEMRLSHDAPDQFQQYDRLRSEGEFKAQISFPLLASVFVVIDGLVPPARGLVAILATAAFGILFAQGIQQVAAARELLCGAIYFGYASTPLLDNLVVSAGQLPNGDRSEGEDLAWFMDFLSDRGLLFAYGEFISKMKHPSRASVLEKALTKVSPQTKAAWEGRTVNPGESGPRVLT